MRNRARARGDREPAGRTKAAVLLYLADSGESTFTGIREHLLEQYNIRSHKDIRTHLADLSDDGKLGLAKKQSNGNGKACSYKVREGFCNLRKLYNYLKDQGAEAKLMRTRHFQEYTASCDFFRKVKTHMLCSILIDLYHCIDSDEETATIMESLNHMPPERKKILASWMTKVRRRDETDPLSRSFIQLAAYRDLSLFRGGLGTGIGSRMDSR